MIIFAHLTSESADPKEKYTLVPYGSFEGFRWINGKWMHVPTVREMDPRPSVNPQQGPTPKENPELLQIRKKTKGGR
jgi:hypothetical protein